MFINNCLIVIGQDFTWPTPKNITEVQAFQKCKTTVEASIAFQGCKDVPDIGFSVSLDSCVIDIQVFTTNHGFNCSMHWLFFVNAAILLVKKL